MASSLAILLLFLRFSSAIAVSSSYISRTTEQQFIATVAPAGVADGDAGQGAGLPFLTSPSGSYAAYLRRGVDGSFSPGGPAGGGDVCYVEVVQQGGSSVWESDCTPVGGADTCDLAFSPMGLELFAGGHSLWDTGVDTDPAMLSLDGAGDMRIVNKDGVTVWRASGDPWTGQRCGSASPSTDVLPPPSTTSAKLLTPPVSTFAGPWGTGTDFSFGDQTAPPVDTSPDQLLPPPPPADASADSPDMPLPPPPADPSTDSPDLPLPPPPADMYPIPETPEQPLYSSPPPAPNVFVPPTALPPPLDTAPLVPPTGSGVTSPGAPLPGIATPPGSSGADAPLPTPPVGTPHPHGPPHQLPFGVSSPVPGALAPSGGHGAGASLPFGQGQQQHGQGPGVFGQQQNQLLNGGGQPLEDSSGGWLRSEHGGAAMVVSALVGVLALAFDF